MTLKKKACEYRNGFTVTTWKHEHVCEWFAFVIVFICFFLFSFLLFVWASRFFFFLRDLNNPPPPRLRSVMADILCSGDGWGNRWVPTKRATCSCKTVVCPTSKKKTKVEQKRCSMNNEKKGIHVCQLNIKKRQRKKEIALNGTEK